MKIELLKMSSITLMSLFLFFETTIVNAEQKMKSDGSINQETAMSAVEGIKRGEIIEYIFSVLYKDKSGDEDIKRDQLIGLLQELEKYGKEHPKDIRSVLFLKAECNIRLGNLKEAFVILYQLKMRIESKDDPLYQEVESRLAKLKNQVESTKIEEKETEKRGWWSPILLVAWSIFLFRLYSFSKKRRKNDSTKDEDDDKGILPKNKLISLEEMCNQDGRCSYEAVKEYKRLREETKGPLPSDEIKRLKFAKLIVDGHEMIRDVNKLTPYPIHFISKIRFFKDLSPYWQYTGISVFFILLWSSIGSITGLSTISPNSTFFLVAIFILSCLTGIKIMSEKTIDSIDEIVCMLEPDGDLNSVNDLERWMGRLFRSPRQFYIFGILMVIIIYIMGKKGNLIIHSDLSNNINFINIDLIFCIILVLMVSSLVWFLIGSLIMMNKVYNLKDLSINPLSPSKTIGLEKWISVIGTYNIVCSIVLSFGCAIAVFKNYMSDDRMIYGSLWFLIITPVLIFYWIYPYIKLGSIVKTKKILRMNFVKTKISILFNEWTRAENEILKRREKEKEPDNQEFIEKIKNERRKIYKKLDEMEKYYKVFKEIEQSPESYLDLNSALELIKVMGFPSLFAVISAILSFYLN